MLAKRSRSVMCPDHAARHRQRGAGLPLALFIITVMALIVASMAQLQQGTSASVDRQILSQRVFLAAESGAQVSVAETLNTESCNVDGTSVKFTKSGLKGCEAYISCGVAQGDIDGGPAPETVYTVKSRAECGVGSELVERTVEIRVR